MTTARSRRGKPLLMGESEAVMLALAEVIEHRDSCTRGHCDRLAVFGVALGMAMRLSSTELTVIHRAAYLHDIGKVAVPDSVLNKPGALSEDEWQLMRTHTLRGEAICQPMEALRAVLPIIRSHHERLDGSGYPDGLRGDEIPRLARIFQFADIFDALTSDRVYNRVFTISEALDVLRSETGRRWRDPEVMAVFETLPHQQLIDAADRHVGHFATMESARQSLRSLSLAVGYAIPKPVRTVSSPAPSTTIPVPR